ncbi:hypothetical protein KI387_033210, partial [Taxus chinensis]
MALMMEGKSVIALMATLVLICGGVVKAQTDCQSLLLSLAPCVTYVTGNGGSAPPAACCTALSSVVKQNASCLCLVLTGNSGIPNVNTTTALGLPKACNVETPPISGCYTVAPTSEPSVNNVPPPIEGGKTNAGALLAPSIVMIFSTVGLVLMK